MRYNLIIVLIIFSICSSQLSLDNFKEQFLIEIEKFKPILTDKNTEKLMTKIAKTYTVEYSYTNKVVDVNNALSNCHLDFEINLVKSASLPASNHLINHIIVGGVIIPGEEIIENKNDLWAGNVGVVLKKDSEYVYSLIFDLRVHFDKDSFVKKSGDYLKDIDEEILVNSIFYNKCLDIAENLLTGESEYINEE